MQNAPDGCVSRRPVTEPRRGEVFPPMHAIGVPCNHRLTVPLRIHTMKRYEESIVRGQEYACSRLMSEVKSIIRQVRMHVMRMYNLRFEFCKERLQRT